MWVCPPENIFWGAFFLLKYLLFGISLFIFVKRKGMDELEYRKVSTEYNELVDKKCSSGLSEDETQRMCELAKQLELYDEEFYAPLIEKLGAFIQFENNQKDMGASDPIIQGLKKIMKKRGGGVLDD